MKIKKKGKKKLFIRLPFDSRKIEMKMKNVKLMGEKRKLIKNIIPNGI